MALESVFAASGGAVPLIRGYQRGLPAWHSSRNHDPPITNDNVATADEVESQPVPDGQGTGKLKTSSPARLALP